MGSSSKQVTGYRYFANFLLFIGNPIEKVLGINFDKRGWQTPLIDEYKNPLAVGVVDLPNLYGENEGGVKGLIHAKYGTKTQSPVDFYVDYLAKNDFPPIAYPYQSYLTFKDFYLGNSGYMKEMLLWPKRIHVRNDGREQWYDLKAEIGKYTHLAPGGQYVPLSSPFSGVVSWTDPGGSGSRKESSSGFPFFDAVQSYGIGVGVNGNPLPEQPSLIAAASTLSAHGMSFDGGTVIPPVTSTSHPPETDGFWNGAIIRQYRYSSFFNWAGGDFEYKGVFSENGASVTLDKVNPDGSFSDGISIADHIPGGGYFYTEGKVNLSRGDYRITVDVGTRYGPQGTPRPFVHFLFKVKAGGPASSGDINPIHKIREILTDDTAMSKPESDVNDINFMKAADRIWDEGLGISWSITEKSCLEAIEELCGHIEAGVRVNRQTGLYEVVLFRDDWFEESEIHAITVNKIKSMSLEVANADEAINQLNVSYYNRDAIKDSSFSIAENASIRNLNGRVNAEDADFPYFMNQRNAAVVAQWKLKQMSSPVWKGSFTTAEYNARKWNRYDLLKLAWPRKWQGTITVRIMKINLGTGADVSIDFVEVVPYSRQLWSDVVIDETIDAGVQPPLACPYEPFEMPYYLAVMALGQRQVDEELNYENNFGLVGVVAEQPQSNSLYAVMMTHDGTEGEEWVRAATIDYEPVADLDQIISRTSASFTVKDSTAIAELPIGTLIKCGSDWIGTPGEWMVFQGVDPYTGVVSVKRGALDSLPQDWGVNTKLYFCGNDVAFDTTEYVSGEEVFVSALTTTPSGMLENKGSIAIEMNARAFRPYPPANVKINGEYWPVDEVTDDVQVSWVDRNRVQQTGGEILGFFDGGVTVENGVTYGYELFDSDTNTLVDSETNITSPATIQKIKMAINNRLELFSIRDGYKSYQSFVYNFVRSSIELWDPSYMQKTIWLDANDSVSTSDGFLTSITDKSSEALVFANSTGAQRFLVQENTEINSKCLVRTSGQYCFNGIAGAALNRANHAWAFYVVKNDSTNATYSDAYLMKTQGSYYGDNFSIMRATGKLHSPQMLIRNYPNNLRVISSDYETDNNWSIVLVHHNFTTGVYTFYVNGVVVKTGSWATGVLSDADGMYIGSANGAFSFKMPLFMVGKTDISQDAQKLIGWAAHKYNLTFVLPVDHPYKNEPPLV